MSYFIIYNITLYIPFVIYNLDFNIINWERVSRVFYSFMVSTNVGFVIMTPSIISELKDSEK